jgi:CBS domain-containing protein
VIRLIDSNDIQRVAVINPDGKLLGIISDSDLLHFFKSKQPGIWQGLSKLKQLFQQDESRKTVQRGYSETTAESVMNKAFVTIGEDVRIETAIAVMIEKGLKRLPVVDDAGRFKGMISRASLLRIGFGDPA